MPSRIQLRRTKGWRLPAGAVSVARPSVFGNPWSLAEAVRSGFFKPGMEADVVVREFRGWLAHGGDPKRLAVYPLYRDLAGRRDRLLARLPELRGKDLACFCPLGHKCHADVLLEIANRPTDETSPARSDGAEGGQLG